MAVQCVHQERFYFFNKLIDNFMKRQCQTIFDSAKHFFQIFLVFYVFFRIFTRDHRQIFMLKKIPECTVVHTCGDLDDQPPPSLPPPHQAPALPHSLWSTRPPPPSCQNWHIYSEQVQRGGVVWCGDPLSAPWGLPGWHMCVYCTYIYKPQVYKYFSAQHKQLALKSEWMYHVRLSESN